MKIIPNQRSDLRVKHKKMVHIHYAGGVATEHNVSLQLVELRDFSPQHPSEPMRLRVLACDDCGAILLVTGTIMD